MLSEEQRELVRETALAVSNATKDENSGLIRDIKVAIQILKDDMIEVKDHIKKTNTTSEKHADLINQTTLVLQQCVITGDNTVKCVEALQKKFIETDKELANNSRDIFAGKISFGVIVALGAVIVGLATWVYNKDITRLENNRASYEEIRA
jgi:hypothetical protein